MKFIKYLIPRLAFLAALIFACVYLYNSWGSESNPKSEAIVQNKQPQFSNKYAPFSTSNGHITVQKLKPGNIIYVKFTGNKKFIPIWKKAISQWNQLHEIVLKPAPKQYNGTYINLHANINDYSNGDLPQSHAESETVEGTTKQVFAYNPEVSNSPAFASNTTCYVFKNIYSLNSKMQTTVAVHEIGHALGFSHDDTVINNQKVIMNPMTNNNSKPLGGYEQKALHHYYF